MTTYAIRNWETYYENHETRKRCKSMSWVKFPNRHDGNGFRRCMSLPDAGTVYAAFCLAVQVASKTPERGVLADEDGPMTPEDLSFKTGLPAEAFARMFDVMSNPQFKIGWILATKNGKSADAGGKSAAVCRQIGTIEENRIEENRIDSPPQERRNPPDSSSDKLQTRTVAEEFKRQCEWDGATDFPYRHFRQALQKYTEEQLIAEIARASPGDKPWDITNRLAGDKSQNWIPKGAMA